MNSDTAVGFCGGLAIGVVVSILVGVMVNVNTRVSMDKQWQVRAVAHGHAEYIPDGDKLNWRWVEHTTKEQQ